MESGGRQTFEAAGAGAILVSTTALAVGAGAFVGWAAGSVLNFPIVAGTSNVLRDKSGLISSQLLPPLTVLNSVLPA